MPRPIDGTPRDREFRAIIRGPFAVYLGSKDISVKH
jgi:hypothetical protein